MRLNVISEYKGASNLKANIYELSTILIDLFTIPNITEDRTFKAHDNTLGFWTDPKSPLLSWLQTKGFRVLPGVPAFADGGSGRCYFLSDNKHVVKMSANRVEANVAKMVAGRTDLPIVIVDLISLPGKLYAILEHFVRTNLPADIKKAADYMMVLVDESPNMVGFPEDSNEQERLCGGILTRFKGDKRLLPHMLMMMDVLLKLYKATGYKHDDAGPTNIGSYNDKVVIPDLGPNGDQDEKLAEIDRERARLGLPVHTRI